MGATPQIIDHDLERGITDLVCKRVAEIFRRFGEPNDGVGTVLVQCVQNLLVASGGNNPSGPEELRYLHGQFARNSGRAKNQDVFAWSQLRAEDERRHPVLVLTLG